MKILKNAIFALSAVLFFSACNNDDEAPTPAESATFTVTIENTLAPKDYLASGATGLLLSGEQEQFTFHAGRGAFLNLATMFVQSNDLFYAFDEKGLELYDESGNAVTGDVTEYLGLWDAGTEVNEAPGDGPNQAPRQSGPNTGMDENGVVGLVNDGYTYPANESVIRVSLAHDGGTEFTLTLENISGSASLPTPLAPGIWAVHGAGVNLFETGKAALRATSYPILDQVLDILSRYSDYKLRISGHTDSTGNAESNQALSQNRAKACYDYLVQKGVSPSRMSYIGYGESRPIANNKYASGREQNRRVEFDIYLD